MQQEYHDSCRMWGRNYLHFRSTRFNFAFSAYGAFLE